MAIPKLHKNIQVRILTSFLSNILNAMTYPFMAIYFSAYFGTKWTGILLLVGIWIRIMVGFYGGYIADKVGRKKIINIGLVIQLTCYAFMALSNSPFFESEWVTLIMFTLNGVSGGLVYPATSALLIDSSTPDNRTFMFSIQYWTSNLSFMIGSLMGGFFFKQHLFELLIGLTLCTLLTLLLTIFAMTDTYQPKKSDQKVAVFRDLIKNYSIVLKDKAFLYFIFASVFLWSMESHTSNFIAVRLAKELKTQVVQVFDFHLKVDGYNMLGFLNTENASLVVIFGIFISAWINNKPMKNLLYSSISIYFIGYILLSISDSLWVIFGLGLVITFGEMFASPIFHTLEAELMDETARGSYSAVASFGGNLNQIFGAIGLTLYGWVGSYGMAVFIAICGVISCYLFHKSFAFHHENKQNKLNLNLIAEKNAL